MEWASSLLPASRCRRAAYCGLTTVSKNETPSAHGPIWTPSRQSCSRYSLSSSRPEASGCHSEQTRAVVCICRPLSTSRRPSPWSQEMAQTLCFVHGAAASEPAHCRRQSENSLMDTGCRDSCVSCTVLSRLGCGGLEPHTERPPCCRISDEPAGQNPALVRLGCSLISKRQAGE